MSVGRIRRTVLPRRPETGMAAVWREVRNFARFSLSMASLLSRNGAGAPFYVALLLLVSAHTARAQQQFQGVCAPVRIQILQELALERIGFLATLEVTNNDGDDPITDFSANLTFENPALSTSNETYDASSLFFVRAPELENIADVDGSGIVPPTQKIIAKWFIIPKPSAGGTEPAGIRYLVGCELSGSMRGVELPDHVMFAIPDMITVRPEPLLDITYFQPRDVQGDDTFTEIVESPVPFILGVLVRNVGYGRARDVTIHSEQPRIIENSQHLLLVAQLLGVRVMDSTLDRTSLTVNIGDLEPGESRKAAWDMITSLSGEFVEFNASYTHAPELGGEETSIITNLAAHFIAKEVLNDQAGRDAILDFLADTDRDANRIPDTLYESEGIILPVNYLASPEFAPPPGPGVEEVRVVADRSDWCYMRLTDPHQAKLPIVSVVRGDGKVINSNNAWTSIRYQKSNNAKLTFLHILDLCNLGSNTYTVTYGAVPNDTADPETTIEFAGVMTRVGTNYYVTPDTQIYFLSEDENPVGIYYALDGGPDQPAYPFRLSGEGAHIVAYHAEDSVGNIEMEQRARVVIVGEPPRVATFEVSDNGVVLTGQALSIRPALTRVTFSGATDGVDTDAQIDIFRGVMPWVTVSNAPSSPTTSDGAALTVGGEYVDHYQYNIDAGAWSAEQDVTAPLVVSGLADGPHTVTVRGRSSRGTYPASPHDVSVTWAVDSGAAATVITGMPATPTRSRDATLHVGGIGVTHYRWTIDGQHYRAETSVTNTIVLEDLTPGAHMVGVRGKIGGAVQPTNEQDFVSLLIDPMYGFDHSSLSRVRHVVVTNIGTGPHEFAWDGRDDGDNAVVPGGYTLRLMLVNELNQTNFTTTLIQVEDLYSGVTELVAADRGPDRPYGRGNWVVWQDQSDGSLEVFVRDLRDGGAARQITVGDLTQKNAKTDGRHAVWQGRRSDGSWDVYTCDLDRTGAVVRVTDTLGTDEENPDIDWPWVVLQTRATSRPNDPWQLRSINLVTGTTNAVWPGPEDQLNPDVDAGRVVWQDWRDVGPGEIYFKNLERGDMFRVTDNTLGQYHPAIAGHWMVWQDTRHSQLELYGYDLRRRRELRLTDTDDNETRPYLDGEWVTCQEDSLGVGIQNLRMIHLPSGAAVPLTRSETGKSHHSVMGRVMTWLSNAAGANRVMSAELPALQAVFHNLNAIPVTATMAADAGDAFELLRRWHGPGNVQEISRFTALAPTLVKETATWSGSAPTGNNFTLTAGEFLWVEFDAVRVADIGDGTSGSVDLAVGINAVSYAAFPRPYSAHTMLRQIGVGNARAIRMLDAASGEWLMSEVRDGVIVGHDFAIPGSAVILVDMVREVNGWQPE